MPVLAKERKTKRIELPSSTKEDPAWVMIYEDVLAGDMILISDIEGKGQAGIEALSKIIMDWNFTEPDGVTKAEVTSGNIKLLSLEDMVEITKNITAFDKFKDLTEVKKNNSLNTSPQK